MLVDYARNCTAGTTPRGGKAGELIHQPWLGAASERANFDYATFVGDLVWVTKTRFELKFAAHTLAMHMRNPGNFFYQRRVSSCDRTGLPPPDLALRPGFLGNGKNEAKIIKIYVRCGLRFARFLLRLPPW